ncbi:unnamed protein product, partial [Phaeothamnion confervicola]
VDLTGNWALLGSRKGLVLVDLTSPYQPAHTLAHQSRVDVGVVRWNPHYSHRGQAVSASNTNVLVWSVEDEGRPLLTTLRKHTRAVTDLSWSPLHPSVLATSSIDSSVLLWDTRAPHAPIQTFRAPHHGAQQVEWNRVNHALLASAHEKDIRVWDVRKASGDGGGGGGAAAAAATAHTQEITGLDWSYASESLLATCSNDKTVKLWDVATAGNSGGAIMQRANPLQRVLFAPFGQAVITTSRGIGEQVGSVWEKEAAGGRAIGGSPFSKMCSGSASMSRPPYWFVHVHSFEGPRGEVVGAAFRVVGDSLFQIVSLDRLQHLRLHRIRPSYLRACGH